jgi:hypothetical protein
MVASERSRVPPGVQAGFSGRECSGDRRRMTSRSVIFTGVLFSTLGDFSAERVVSGQF